MASTSPAAVDRPRTTMEGMTLRSLGYFAQMTNDDDHDNLSVDPDPTDPDREDVDRLDDDAPGASLFDEGDDNEPAEPA